jgi:hypothetical protein
MEIVLKALVIVVQLALVGFVLWGAWLCFSAWFRELRGARASHAARQERSAPLAAALEPKPEAFERVASLVLLALLCTTLTGLI